ncbi:hypothetical protein [Kitasatospora sp. McL0602]|uniref:hypothetical protein n=1 Tax=Kitasatospora sp. McL0602 TaxID=3439530 RepID=UPI003F8C3D5D
MTGGPKHDAALDEARRLLGTPWRTDADAILEGARRLIALGPQYVEEALHAIGLHVSGNHHLSSGQRIEAARIRAALGGEQVRYAAAGLRGLVNEYRGYVEAWDNIDGAFALAGLAPEYVPEGAWELRSMILSRHPDEWDRSYAMRRLVDLTKPRLMPEFPYARQDFPAYTLLGWAAERWIEGWGNVGGRADQPMWFVSTGHRTAGGGTVVVSTWRGLGTLRNGTNGPEEARQHALVDSLAGALGLAFPRDGVGGRAEEDFDEATAALLPVGRHLPTHTLTVDNGRIEFEVVPVGDAWAAVAELGVLAIGAYGRGAAPDGLQLVTGNPPWPQHPSQLDNVPPVTPQ